MNTESAERATIFRVIVKCCVLGVDVRRRVSVGRYPGGANNSTCDANLDKLMGFHAAVLGSTEAGKSGTVAAIIRRLLDAEVVENDQPKKLRPRIVLIDPHGEYSKAFDDRCVVFQAYSTAATEECGPNVLPLRLPYWLMSGEEFRDLLIEKSEREATSEHNIVLKALRHSRLAARGLIESTKMTGSANLFRTQYTRQITDPSILTIVTNKN